MRGRTRKNSSKFFVFETEEERAAKKRHTKIMKPS